MAEKKWMGTVPTKCDICERPLKGKFIDGKTSMGPWANMCVSCHSHLGFGLGTGRGQLYDLTTLKKLEG